MTVTTAEPDIADRIRTIMTAVPSAMASDQEIIALTIQLVLHSRGEESGAVQHCEELAAQVHDLAAQRTALREKEMAVRSELEAELARLT